MMHFLEGGEQQQKKNGEKDAGVTLMMMMLSKKTPGCVQEHFSLVLTQHSRVGGRQ